MSTPPGGSDPALEFFPVEYPQGPDENGWYWLKRFKYGKTEEGEFYRAYDDPW